MASTITRAVCLAAASGLLQLAIAAPSSSLPIVDLGYERHQAYSYNETGGFYNFTNIRYAAPPLGDLRFRAPQPPAKTKTLQTGSVGRICPQADPAWLAIAEEFIPLYLAGQTVFNESSFNLSGISAGKPDPLTSEDCLFLDVLVPKSIFDRAGTCEGAPVMVWIYGGGYTAGSKYSSGNPAGLIARSLDNGDEGIIYVALNYRLGAFGWLSGPEFEKDGTPNAGLYDQRFALEWVQEHISKFGGDPSRVTVFGESAGGGSIMHQVTAYGGEKPVPFKQIIAQSPGFEPFTGNKQLNTIYQDFLALLNVSTIAEARKLSTEQLQLANVKQVGASPYGGFTYGPTVDGNFVPELPGVLLSQGRFAKDLNVMVGHNLDEGLLFTSPFIQNNSAFREAIVEGVSTIKEKPGLLKYVTETLYPPIFDGSQAQNYTNQIARYAALNSEVIFTCNTFYLDKAFANRTYSYYFTIYPGIHGEDVPYTYYNGPNPSVVDPTIAIALQNYLTDFAMFSTPNGPGVPEFPIYGAGATVQDLNLTGISQVRDPAANYRCDWWQKALYAGKAGGGEE